MYFYRFSGLHIWIFVSYLRPRFTKTGVRIRLLASPVLMNMRPISHQVESCCRINTLVLLTPAYPAFELDWFWLFLRLGVLAFNRFLNFFQSNTLFCGSHFFYFASDLSFLLEFAALLSLSFITRSRSARIISNPTWSV